MVECLKNVFVHPSSGHVNSPSADAVDSSSVLTWAAEAREPFEWILTGRLFTAEENELGCALMTVIDGSPSDDGMSNFCGISLPVPTPYALHARITSLDICIFERALTPSILYWPTGELTMDSQRVTLTDCTPPEDRIASHICAGVSMSCPAFRWVSMCAFIVAALWSQAPFPPWGSEKSSRLTATPSSAPNTLAQIMVAPQW